jgi:ComEC/Rec2-related protein
MLVISGMLIVAARHWRWVAIGLLFGVLGFGRAQLAHAQSDTLTSQIGQKVTLSGEIADDPTTNAANTASSFVITNLHQNGHALDGELYVYTHRITYERGYHLTFTGKLKTGFGPYDADISYPTVTQINPNQSWLERMRQRFFVGMKTALPEPAASFALGLLIGVRAIIPKPLQVTLAAVGLSHLVAVSGYNLTIIVQAANRLLGRLGSRISLVLTLWLIGGFVIVSGASASIIRAGLVSVLVLLAGMYGRQFQPLNLILLAAAGTAAYRPSYLSDLGWLLSFLAFFGIAVLAPAVSQRLGNPKRTIVKLLIESTCAQIMTIPLIMLTFDQLSVVSPITNLLILPLVPIAMLVSFIAGLAGMFIPAFCGWLSWPASLLIQAMLALINWFGSLHFASLAWTMSAGDAVASYGLIGVIATIMVIAHRRRLRDSETTPRILKSSSLS